MTSRADPLRHLETELADLERRGLLRVPPSPAPTPAGERLVVLCSNDYLGYAAAPWSSPPAPSGAGASRLVTGEHRAHGDAEQALSAWLRTGASLLFSSGYAANVGAIEALARPGDLIVSDALNHASIIDGCRLSGAHIVVVPHRDPAAVERALTTHRGASGSGSRATSGSGSRATSGSGSRAWVVTESYFSMDGDSPDLRALRSICDAHDAALYVDEAHALGVLGPEGRGACAEASVVPDVLVGTLGKALGLQGAFVTGTPTLRTYLWNRARSFVFSTGVSPALASRIRDNIERAAADEPARTRLHHHTRQLREGLERLGVNVLPDSRGPILPWLVGPESTAMELSRSLRAEGILVQPIRPPTVPAGTSRLRITATATLSEQDITLALRAIERVLQR
jgi:8-amino-7-oxononanoate synthase